MIALLKSLLVLLEPVGLIWLLLAVWLWMQRRQSPRVGGRLVLVAWLLLTAFACTPLTSLMLLSLEQRNQPNLLEKLRPAPAVICLGGSCGPSLFEVTGINFGSNVDRILSSLLLLSRGKGGALVLGGGAYRQNGGWASEANELQRFLREVMGRRDEIISLGRCSDTHDEAVKTAALCAQRGWKDIVLVTSAVHLPRAKACFEKQGLVVQAVGCDFISSFRNPSAEGTNLFFHLPKVGSIQGLGSLIHEWVGLLVYWWRGWI